MNGRICSKCNGLVVPETISVMKQLVKLDVIRCINCGLLLDELMMYNKTQEAERIRKLNVVRYRRKVK